MNPFKDLPADEVGLAALSLCGALMTELLRKEVLDPQAGNAIFAVAALMCEAAGKNAGAVALREMCPTSGEVNAIEWIKAGGGTILQ